MKEKEKVARPGRFELPTLCLEGRRSIQLSYGRILGYSIDSTKVATPIRHPTSSAITEQVGAIGMGGTMNQSQLTLLPQTKLEFQIQARVSV